MIVPGVAFETSSFLFGSSLRPASVGFFSASNIEVSSVIFGTRAVSGWLRRRRNEQQEQGQQRDRPPGSHGRWRKTPWVGSSGAAGAAASAATGNLQRSGFAS